jgi:hypothetical protein
MLISTIKNFFKHRKEMPMNQEQNFPEQDLQMSNPVPKSQTQKLKNSKMDTHKTVEDAPAPGEEGAP